MKESELVNESLKTLLVEGLPAIRINTRVISGFYPGGKKMFMKTAFRADGVAKGIPDILICVEGVYVAAEAKVGKRKATPEQEEFFTAIRNEGGVAFVFHTVEELMEQIERIRNERRRP